MKPGWGLKTAHVEEKMGSGINVKWVICVRWENA